MDQVMLVAPSLLAADLGNLQKSMDAVASADILHFDVMDGHFTKNLTFGAGMIEAVKSVSSLPVDAHLMVSNPDDTVDWYLDAGADFVTVHYEAVTHLHRVIWRIKDAGRKAGVVLNPATPVSVLRDIVCDLDMVLIMSVNPGFGGQKFIENTFNKLSDLTALCDERGARPLIEIDGGVSSKNAETLGRAGANVLVAGSAVFGADDPAAEISAIRANALVGLASRA